MGRGLRVTLVSALGFFGILELILIPAILYWPDFEENVAAIKKLAPILKLRNVVGLLEVTGVDGYVIAQHFFKGCMLLGVPAAILFAMGAVAGEARRGTLEIVLARPLPRWRILLERWLQGAVGVVAPVFATSLTIPWLLSFVDDTMELEPLVLSSVHASSLLLATYSLTFLLSTVGRRPILIAFVMTSIMVGQAALYIVERVTHWSIFRLVDIPVYLDIYEHRRLDWSILAWLYGAAALFLLASLAAFQRRVP
jgi:ABC-2 type transport system permease protein